MQSANKVTPQTKAINLNCEKCGKQVLDEKSSFCAYCGTPLGTSSKTSGHDNTAGILALIASTLTLSSGFLGIINYQTYVTYYTAYGYDTSEAIGFLIFATFAFVASAVGFVATLSALKRKHFSLTIIGNMLLITSVICTYIIVWQYNLGFADGIITTGIPTLALSLAAIFSLLKSKNMFSTKNSTESAPIEEEAETQEFDETEWKD
jgi:ribosomal protein L37E